jgi:hypothetical protein
VRSGLRAADAILSGNAYDLAGVGRYSLGAGLLGRLLERLIVGRGLQAA